MSRVFPDLDDLEPDQPELGFPASHRDRSPAAAPAEAEPARAEFFRSQRRPVLPLLGLFGAAATIAAFLWLGREEAVPGPEAPGDGLAPVAAAPGFEAPLPSAEGTSLEGATSPGSLAAPVAPEASAPPAPMPVVPSVLDEAPPLEAAPAPRASAATGSSFSVQLLAGRSEAGVGSSWERLRGEYPELLSSLTPSVTPTSRPEGDTFYRLRAGPLRDRASADALCKALSTRQQSCFVVSPGS